MVNLGRRIEFVSETFAVRLADALQPVIEQVGGETEALFITVSRIGPGDIAIHIDGHLYVIRVVETH